LTQYLHVTDRQTDVQAIAKTCFSIADARKKKSKVAQKHKIPEFNGV